MSRFLWFSVYIHLNWHQEAASSARMRNVWGLTEFCFVFRFGFRATLLDFTSRISGYTFATTAQMNEEF